jgi:hypothetical protein
MKKNIRFRTLHFFLTLILIITTYSGSYGQSSKNKSWILFYDEQTELIGFKNNKGHIIIEPKFIGFTTAQYVDHIVAVIEENEETYKAYYLTTDKKTVGFDSLWIVDNTPDCESEGYIRFRDKLTDKVGLFNGKGEIAVPADYDELSKVLSGLVVALKGSTKQYLDDEYEYYTRNGGRNFLININNEILIEDFPYNQNINLYSLKISSNPEIDESRVSYMGINGKYYTFIDYEKEFNNWFKTRFLDDFSSDVLLKHSFDSLFIEEDDNRLKLSKSDFTKNYFFLLNEKMNHIKASGSQLNSYMEDLNPFIFDSPSFEQFYNNCHEPRTEKYPVMTVTVSNERNNPVFQNTFSFLRTDKGYKLIAVTLD